MCLQVGRHSFPCCTATVGKLVSCHILQGRWGSHGTANELELLMASLDRRGVRELALVEVSEKQPHSTLSATRGVAGWRLQVRAHAAAQLVGRSRGRACHFPTGCCVPLVPCIPE